MRNNINNIHILLAVLILIACHGCVNRGSVPQKAGQSPVTMDSLVQQEHLCLKSCMSFLDHAEQCNMLDSLTQDFNIRAGQELEHIQSLLGGRTLDAYKAERLAFTQWQDFQQSVSDDAIYVIWELLVEGNAIRDIMLAHLYDIANINLADQTVLAGGLVKDRRVERTNESASFEQITQFKEELINLLDFASNTGANDDKGLDISKAKDVIATDYSLFKAWMKKRKDLESCLPEYCKALFSANTGYWMQYYCKRYQGHLIDSPIP